MAMAMAKSAVIFFPFMALIGASMAAVYTVGDSAGWTTVGNIDYKKWADGKDFQVGDTLVFKYNPQRHDVRQVSQEDFESCNGKSPIATYVSGSDSITLNETGHICFLCGFPGHCQVGQKVDILVNSASTSPRSSPTPNPNSTMTSPSVTTQSSKSNNSPSLFISSFWFFSGMLAISLAGFVF